MGQTDLVDSRARLMPQWTCPAKCVVVLMTAVVVNLYYRGDGTAIQPWGTFPSL